MRILVAEDDKDILKALVTILEKEGYQVDAVENGNDAFYYVQQVQYDALILDIMMPQLSGIEALQKLRACGIATPTLLLTAKGEISDKVTGLDAGADDYLPKPFAVAELLARLRALLRRKSDLQPNVLNFGTLILDRNTFELVHNNEHTRLIGREYQIMELLMLNSNQIVSTERILEQIWGWNSEVDVSVIWVNISNLRKKLAAVGSSVEIQSARGIGYQLKAAE